MQARKAFAKILRKCRTNQGLSQEKLAFKAGLSMQMISLLECEKCQPTLDTIFILAKALNISATKLIKAVEQHTKEGH